MKKQSLLNLIEQVKTDAELKEIDGGTRLKLLDLLLDYINDPDVRKAVDEVPF